MIKFVVATIENFKAVGIDVSTCRKSIDNLKALKHIENLSAEELNLIRANLDFEFIGDDIYTLMETDEWIDLEALNEQTSS